jgi:hypothetical protein
MILKRILPILCAMPTLTLTGVAQAPTYNFTFSTDTAIESNATVIVGYVKTNIPPTANDSVLISRTAGNPRPSHMDASSQFIVRFSPGQDSSAFSITLYDDTFPELPDHVTYTLTTYGTIDTIGSNRTLDFVLLDNDLPATITWVIDTGSAWIDDGRFSVCATISNPNQFNVRFYTRTYDASFTTPLAVLTAAGGFNYFYDWGTIEAPPGISTWCQDIRIVSDTAVLPNKTLLVMLQNIDDNILTDSVFHFTIRNGNSYTPPSVSFDFSNITIQKDTALLFGIPLTTISNNHLSFSFLVDTFAFSSVSSFDSAALYHVYLNNNYFNHAGGIWHDTLWINILDDHLIFDTSTIVFRIKGVKLNTSPDTLFHLTIIDTGSLVISFKGAGFAHLKGDSIGYVQVYTSAPVKYPVTASVTYLNGNAVAGVDYLWKDTLVTFPANMFDTISLPVIMLKNHIHDGNKQINFQLSNASPAPFQYDIIQYTYTIIDNDSTASYPAGTLDIDNSNEIKLYPNPFISEINIHSDLSEYEVSIINMVGQRIVNLNNQSGDIRINLNEIPSGTYLMRISDSDKSSVRMITKM